MPCFQRKSTSAHLAIVANSGVNKQNAGYFLEANYVPYYKDLNSRGKPYMKLDKILRVDSVLAQQLAEATYEINSMCLEVVDMVAKSDQLLRLFEIPASLWGFIRRSWAERQADLMGRFDFLIDGGSPKLMEYNADTPTLLVECGVAQRFLTDVYKQTHPVVSDFNFVAEALKTAWADRIVRSPGVMHVGVACDISDLKSEDYSHSNYVRLLAEQAVAGLGLPPGQVQVHILSVKDISFDPDQNKVKSVSKGIYLDILWKLYPYEWMAKEQISIYFDFVSRLPLGAAPSPTYLLEPPWKLIISSKALLPLLWALYPNHPNLLPSFFDNPFFANGNPGQMLEAQGTKKWILKPRFGREGVCNYIAENKELKQDRLPKDMKVDSYFGGPVFQAFQKSVKVEGMNICASSWVVNGLPVGFCFRFSKDDITDTGCHFMPFFIEGEIFGEFRATEVQKSIREGLYVNEATNKGVYGPRTGNFSFRITNNVPQYSALASIAPQDAGGQILETHKEFSPLVSFQDQTINMAGRADEPLRPVPVMNPPPQPYSVQPHFGNNYVGLGQPTPNLMATPAMGTTLVAQHQSTLQPTGHYGEQRWSTPYAQEEGCCLCFFRPTVAVYRRGLWGGYYYRWPFYSGYGIHGGWRRHYHHHRGGHSHWGIGGHGRPGGHHFGGGARFGHGFGGGFGG